MKVKPATLSIWIGVGLVILALWYTTWNYEIRFRRVSSQTDMVETPVMNLAVHSSCTGEVVLSSTIQGESVLDYYSGNVYRLYWVDTTGVEHWLLVSDDFVHVFEEPQDAEG